ncbi:hypothetical protein Glove_154g34 [Diversispora epigaea]|uniref:Uncharacterized protein n=1 Tax=Diversispora epigaea TaxID=1348612 RepID=A0A397J1G4_9GLOM|nr:hypothetical protein Glove_154g34 [Diversispora epigaea]
MENTEERGRPQSNVTQGPQINATQRPQSSVMQRPQSNATQRPQSNATTYIRNSDQQRPIQLQSHANTFNYTCSQN